MSAVSNQPCPRCGNSLPSDATHCGTCGQHQVDQPPETWIGRTVDGKYEVTDVLGVGGMGMVFRARRVLVGDEVALKVLFPRFLESPLQRRLFQDEAIASARLSHPHVVTVFDAELDSEGTAYIAMELLEGDTFKSVLRAEAPMQAERVLPTMVQVCEALAAAHAKQIVHRDLKPDNIFLQLRGGSSRVKLVDFGIAAMLDADERDEQRRLLGTLRYMAPEQCLGDPVDRRTDLYALGVVLYESLTRRRATGKSVSAVLEDEVKPPNLVLPEDQHIPHRLEQLVLRLVAKHPEDRPDNALEVRDELLAIQDDLLAPPTEQHEPVSKKGLYLGLAAAALAGVLAGLLWGVLK